MSNRTYPFRQQPLCRLTNLEYMRCSSDWAENRQFLGEYRLLLITGGKGELLVDNERFPLFRGKVFLLIPAMLIEMKTEK